MMNRANTPEPASASINTVEWSFVANLIDLPNGKQRCARAAGESVIVCRVYGEVFVVKNYCPHLGKPLEGGRLQEYELSCPHHNAVFDIRDGRPVAGPSVRPAQTYPCRVVDGRIYAQINRQKNLTLPQDPRMRS